MKQLLFFLAMLFSFSAFGQLTDTEDKALDKLIASQVEIEADAINTKVLKNTFDATFYKVKITKHFNNNGGFNEIVLMKQNGKMLEVTEAESLVPFIKADFKLNSMAEASQLKEALKLILDSAYGRENEISQKGNQWILVCEEWFGDRKGFVVTTENGGKISKIEYSNKLEI